MTDRDISNFDGLTQKQLLRLAESAFPPVGSDITPPGYQRDVPVDGKVDNAAGSTKMPQRAGESGGEPWIEPRTGKLWRKEVVGRQQIVHGTFRNSGSIVGPPKSRGIK